jgi:hypothetical protein
MVACIVVQPSGSGKSGARVLGPFCNLKTESSIHVASAILHRRFEAGGFGWRSI